VLYRYVQPIRQPRHKPCTGSPLQEASRVFSNVGIVIDDKNTFGRRPHGATANALESAFVRYRTKSDI